MTTSHKVWRLTEITNENINLRYPATSSPAINPTYPIHGNSGWLSRAAAGVGKIFVVNWSLSEHLEDGVSFTHTGLFLMHSIGMDMIDGELLCFLLFRYRTNLVNYFYLTINHKESKVYFSRTFVSRVVEERNHVCIYLLLLENYLSLFHSVSRVHWLYQSEWVGV